jgi:hypothetical protein
MMVAVILSLAVSVSGFSGIGASPPPPASNKCATLCAKTQNCTLTTSISMMQENEYCAADRAGHLTIPEGLEISCSPSYRYHGHGQMCNISLSFTMGISLRNSTTLRASAVSLTSTKGHILVAPGAKIDAEGLGMCDFALASPIFKANSHQSGSQFTGAGHGGWGGACFGGLGSDGQPYGDGTAPLSPSPLPRIKAEYPTFALDHFGSGTFLAWWKHVLWWWLG